MEMRQGNVRGAKAVTVDVEGAGVMKQNGQYQTGFTPSAVS